MRIFSKVFILFMLLSLASCGSGDGSDQQARERVEGEKIAEGESLVLNTGYFIDSPVQGLHYAAESISGYTNSEGAFQFADGELITFSIGGVILGQSYGQEQITPVDLIPESSDQSDSELHPAVINILRLLQTLDHDDNRLNGITISAEYTQALSNTSVDFYATDFESSAAVNQLLQQLDDELTLVSEEAAIDHFETYQQIMRHERFTVGGSVLERQRDYQAPALGGESLVLSLNDQIDLTMIEDGYFTFDHTLVDGSPYTITIKQQPSTHDCSLHHSSGVIQGTSVSTIEVVCEKRVTEAQHVVSLSVEGLSGVLRVDIGVSELNPADRLINVDQNGVVQFPEALGEGEEYALSIIAQPENQRCDFSNEAKRSGFMPEGGLEPIGIICTTTNSTGFHITASVTGLEPTDDALTVSISDQSLSFTQSGEQTFGAAFLAGEALSVSLSGARYHECSIGNIPNTLTENITIEVSCNSLKQLHLSVEVLGLTEGNIDLSNGTSKLTFTQPGAQTFPELYAPNQPYMVTLDQTALEKQACFVNGGSQASGNILYDLSMTVLCDHAINVTAIGLDGDLVLYGKPVGTDAHELLSFSASGAQRFCRLIFVN